MRTHIGLPLLTALAYKRRQPVGAPHRNVALTGMLDTQHVNLPDSPHDLL